ncbi:MAG: sulfurtransferase TusA family protein [Mycobacteriales bacterium]
MTQNPVTPREPARVLDCRGKRCPIPVIELARAITAIEIGAMLRVIADDPAAAHDIAAWCRMRGHEFAGGTTVADSPAFDVIRCG